MQVRTFSEKDATPVKDLIISILSREYPFDKNVYENTDLSDIRKTYGGKKETFLVIEAGDKIVGTIGIKEDSESTALIRRLFVDPACRRRGYGSLLLEKALRYCANRNYKEVVFRTTGRMIQAINLLRKNHFTERDRIDLGGFTIHTFIKKLSPER